MAKRKKRRRTDEERRAFDERTRMIEEYIAKLRRRVEEKQADAES